MKQHIRIPKMTAPWLLCVALALWGGLTVSAYAQTTKAVKAVDLSNLPSVRVVVPDIKMCPGEEYDLPFYLESDQPDIVIPSLQLLVRFPDYDVLEPAYDPKDVHAVGNRPGSKSVGVLITNKAAGVQSALGMYHIANHGDFPDHTMPVSFASSKYTPKPGEPMFCVRVRCKEQKPAAVVVDTNTRTYSNIWVEVGTAMPPVKKLYADVAHVMPAPDPEVSIINDTMMCVNETIRFWADGGVRYEWEDISSMERPFLPAMVDNRNQTPLFHPQEPGYYTYRCKITNRMGCSAYDTMQCIVLNNLLNMEATPDTMVDMGTPADLSATVWGAFAPPYTLAWDPANLVTTPQMTLSAIGPTQRLWVENQSLPLTKSQWFTARLNDGYCKLETVRNVNVYGSDIEGYVQMNPSRFCVYETIDETIKLSVRVHGGSGQYTYLWGVENLEPDKPAPVFETVQSEPEARLRFHSRCVVYVDVNDWEARKVTRITDTLRFDEVSPVTVELIDLNGPSTCEQSEMRFAAKSENAGDDPRYGWFINRVEVLRSRDSVFSTYQLKPGDELYCILTSDKLCVQNVQAKSNVLNPNVVYPGYMTVLPSFGSDAVNKTCGDSLALGILHRNTGKKFRLRWYRNDVEVMADRYVEHDQMTGNNDVMDYTNVERIGYHDYYRAVVTESDRACLLDDSLVTMAMYPRLEPNWLVKAGDIYVHPEDRESVCSGHSLVVYAPDVRYLPSQFRLVWYVKREGKQPAARGYYATPGFTDNAAYGRNLGSSSEFTASDDYYRAQNWILKGFPVSLTTEGYNNGEADLQDGDSVYYTVETFATRCVPNHKVSSACVGVRIETSLADVPQSLLYMSPAPPVSQFCEGTEFRFFPHPAYYEDQKEVTYTWFLNGTNLNDLYPEKFSGDTVTVTVRNGDMMMLRATTSHRCMKPGVSRVSETRSRMSGMYDGFSLITAKDTMICSGEPVALWAVGAPYKEPARLVPQDVAGVPDWLPNYEGKVTVEWAESLADAQAGRFVHTGILFTTTVDSARFGDRSADLHDDTATVGTQTFVARITSANGCVGYDSVRVTVGYNRPARVVVVPEPAFPWCESAEDAYLKLEGENWGENPKVFLRVDKKWYPVERFDSIPYVPSALRRGVALQGGIYSSMLTCSRTPDAYSEEISMELRTQTLAWLSEEGGVPASELSPAVCQGAELKVESFGSTLEELQAMPIQLTLDEIRAQLRDGYEYRWTDKATGTVVSTESTLAVVPEVSTVYELTVQDTAHYCPAVKSEVNVRMAVETGISFSFSDAFTGKEIPFSICEGGEATELTWRAHPQNFTGKAYIGFAIMTAESGYKKARQTWTVTNPDTAITAWFRPGDRVVYGYFHDTLSCSGESYLLDSIDLQMGRPLSESFRGAPDMLLCQHESKRLFVLNAKENVSELPAGAPSLKSYLLSQGVPGAATLPDDGYSATGHLSPDAPLIYWWPLDGFVDESERTSMVPEVSPDDKAMYMLWAYNEYGCIQSDSVRVERYDEKDLEFGLLLLASDSVLCDSDDMFFTLDRYESSILTMFDSLVWKRVPAGGTQPEILARGKEVYYLHVAVAHGDTVYVEGYVKGDSLCVEVDAAWYTSNKIAVQRYSRPLLTLQQVETAACADSTLELRATADAAFVQWLRVESPDKGYEVLERGPADQQTAWARVRTYHDFTARATAYNHPACAAIDSVAVSVASALDTLYIELADPQVVCDGVPVTIEVADRRFVDSWQWRLNGAYMTYEDFESEAVMSDFLLGTLSSFRGPFKAGDRIWAEGSTNSRCVRSSTVLSDTITVERSVTPVLTWIEPDGVAVDEAVRRLEACAGEPLPLRLHVAGAEDFAAVWQVGDTRTELTFNEAATDDKGTVYELTAAYPSAATAWLHVGAIRGGCMAEDSLQIVGYARDTLVLELASSAASVCSGEEVHYGIVRQAHIDSVVWYVNDRNVLAGPIRQAPTYAYRPAAGDRVWAVGYNTTGHCVYNNGLRSEELSVEVTSNGTPGVVIAALTASADSVCGAGAPVYTVSGRGFDSVYWYANGRLAAITDMLDGVRAVSAARTATWRHVPRPAEEGPDSVYAVAVRRAKICALRNEQTTNVVSVLRREKPEVRITPRDTSVLTGYDLILEGSGASAYVWWTDAESGIAGTMGTFTLVGHGDTVMVYTMGYEPAFNRDSLAGGQTPAPAQDAYGEFTCLAFDSVLVRPDAIKVLDSSVIFIPNAVLRNSARPADRVFRVYGENIASVHMRIFNNNGDLVFEKTDANPVWKADGVLAGNYTYRIVITLQDGTVINKSGWISVLE